MNPKILLHTTRRTPWRAAWVLPLAAVAAAALVGCSEREAPANAPAPAATSSTSATSAPASAPAAAPASSPGAPASATAAAAAPPSGAGAREVPVNVQGVASAGLTVRVKGIELGEDATVLSISASFGGQAATYTKLAAVETYLEDPDGNRLMLKRPADNKDLKIMNGDTMEGKLVFLGRVAPTAAQLRLVINDGSESDNTIGPGLAIVLPLKG